MAVGALERFRDWLLGHEGSQEGAHSVERRVLEQVLRCLAQYAFETSERTTESNRALWQSLADLVILEQYPDIPRKACEYRRAEQSFVVNQMNDLRDLAWTLIGGLSQLIQQESEDSDALSTHIQHLNEQLRSGESHIPVDILKSTLRSLTEVVQEREQRHQQVRTQLQTQVHNLMQELEQARRESALDPLTQLFNRRALDAQLQHMIQLNSLFGYP
ncbi:MAG: GGDEF domain-containing protein, partial [Fimbriimonadales bacterium]